MKTTLVLSERQTKFLEFVKAAHHGQKRKYTGEDYWEHPYAVACIVNDAMEEPGLLIEVALGHGLYEDTPVEWTTLTSFMETLDYTRDEILYVTLGIQSLTDIYTSEQWPLWNRERRKKFEVQRLTLILPDYQSVKYADLIHNTESIVEHDKGFAGKYLQEKEDTLTRMRLGDITLLIAAYDSLNQAKSKL